MTRQAIGELATGFAIIMPPPMAMYWLLFAFAMYPWIVPPDHSGSIVDAGENAATVGIGLAVVSCLTPLWAAGMLSRGWFAISFGMVLLAAIAIASVWLYPPDDSIHFLPMRSFAHAVGAIAVALGLAGLRLYRPGAPERKGGDSMASGRTE